MKDTINHNQPPVLSSPIDVVFFDFGGVLAEEGFREGLLSIAHKNRLNPDSFLKTAYEITFNQGFVTGNIDESVFWKLLRKRTGIKDSDSVLRNEILSRFILRDWMFGLIKRLKKSLTRRAIVSDQTNWLEELNDKQSFFEYFDCVFNSYFIGMSKKEPRMFDYVISEMKTKPERSLFIDDAKDNIERAKQRGLHVILYSKRDL